MTSRLLESSWTYGISGLLVSVGAVCVLGATKAYVERDLVAYEFFLYVVVVHIAFHLGEFWCERLLRNPSASVGSFMFFHSWAYLFASLFAFCEFTIWSVFRNGQDRASEAKFVACSVAAFLTLFFYLIRLVAMFQAGSNFSLSIVMQRDKRHSLVTTGVYSRLRHPSYFGWFWRTACAQLILGNWVSLILHTYVTWSFFKQRIPFEESILQSDDFFGEEYKAYKSSTMVGIPFL